MLARLLRTPDGRWRAPWRLVVFGVAVVVGRLVATSLLYPVLQLGARTAGVRFSFVYVLLCAALLFAHVAALRWFDERPWQDVGMGARAWGPGALVAGTLSGALGIGIPVLLLVGVGWLAIVGAPDGSSLALAAWLLLTLAPAALWEELAFRGYPLTVLADAWGRWPAVAATSLAFGLIHLTNPGAEWRAVALVTLAGVWLGVVRFATGSLWAAWLAHLAWNWTMAAIFHAPVSGLGLGVVDWQLTDAGPDWATGGRWGPEGGLFAALGMVGGTLWFMLRPRDAHGARGGAHEAGDTQRHTRP